IPERLWTLPPSTFSGGEQQRVNIARGFISDMPILLLDEPTASLDGVNRKIVVDLVAEKKTRGVAMVAIVHDDEVR
ncbi:ATP-binding cassette domain-containing protein, partial [Klebsiella pneumoniae]|nr:ATP-binding cassette domain-containing protein [Klebsiella pneumoniae]